LLPSAYAGEIKKESKENKISSLKEGQSLVLWVSKKEFKQLKQKFSDGYQFFVLQEKDNRVKIKVVKKSEDEEDLLA
jgi:guanylate kinase